MPDLLGIATAAVGALTNVIPEPVVQLGRTVGMVLGVQGAARVVTRWVGRRRGRREPGVGEGH